jgi:hypothetical protein
MNNIKNKFSQNEWKLVQCLIESPRTVNWLELAKAFLIKEDSDPRTRAKASNDIWRKFLKLSSREESNLSIVKQTLNGKGEVLFETTKVLPETKNPSLEGFKISKVTTNPHGGEWITYQKNIEIVEEKTTVNVVQKLIDKHIGLIPDYESNKNEYFSYLEEEPFAFDVRSKLAVVNLYDAHLDKLPIKSVCGVESTLEQNVNVFLNTIDRICKELLKNDVDEIVFPIGNDLFHTNGFNSQTKKGTQIEYYGSPEDAYYAICDAITEATIRLAVVAKYGVKVIMVKGNHDEDKITTLGYWLQKFFQGTNVEVDFLRKQRKYIKFGENLIGFAHGDKEKSKIPQLPLIMAQEAKGLWGSTTYRKMYLGDLHHGFEYQFLKAKDMPGVEVEYLRSVGTTDSWHEDFGWVGIPKTAYLQIFDKEEGEINRIKFNIK